MRLGDRGELSWDLYYSGGGGQDEHEHAWFEILVVGGGLEYGYPIFATGTGESRLGKQD